MKIIKVTERHIINGERNCPRGCPIALALIDAGYRCVAVNENSIEFGTDFDYFQVRLLQLEKGLDILDFIYDFDRGKNVSPILFELPVLPTRTVVP